MIQKSLRTIGVTTLLFGYLLLPIQLLADTPEVPDLIMAQVKITTSGQFVSLYNNTNKTIDMSSVALQYFNNYQLGGVTSTKTVQLSGNLPAHSYYTVNDGPLTLCYQTVVQSASLNFSTKSGLLEIVRLSQSANSGIGLSVQDFVAWSNTKVSGVETMPADPSFLQRQISAGKPVTKGSWQQVKPSSSNVCELITSSAPSAVVPSGNNLLPASPPSAKIISTMADSNTSISNNGLMKPQLTELLPDPASPQTDANDEFVEVYNANNAKFDLTGFKLQTVSQSGTKHTYTFPAGTTIPAKSYAAYPSANISISLTNSGGRVWLLDSNEKVIGQTESYAKAEEGHSWALASGKWYWTSTPTPGKANEINGIKDKSKSASGVGTVLGSSTTGSAANAYSKQDGQPPARNLNSAVLVGIGSLAVVYGLYEYRRDLANRVQKFKRNRAIRRENRPKT